MVIIWALALQWVHLYALTATILLYRLSLIFQRDTHSAIHSYTGATGSKHLEMDAHTIHNRNRMAKFKDCRCHILTDVLIIVLPCLPLTHRIKDGRKREHLWLPHCYNSLSFTHTHIHTHTHTHTHPYPLYSALMPSSCDILKSACIIPRYLVCWHKTSIFWPCTCSLVLVVSRGKVPGAKRGRGWSLRDCVGSRLRQRTLTNFSSEGSYAPKNERLHYTHSHLQLLGKRPITTQR